MVVVMIIVVTRRVGRGWSPGVRSVGRGWSPGGRVRAIRWFWDDVISVQEEKRQLLRTLALVLVGLVFLLRLGLLVLGTLLLRILALVLVGLVFLLRLGLL